MLPAIRYPLPTLVGFLLVGLIVWRGQVMTRPLRSALAARWQRAIEGPPVPSSDHPQVVAGPITRKGLLLHEGVEAARTPGGMTVETIRVRMFVDVYDVWPLSGEPGFFRVGNRRPVGWVKRADLLPWDTRLVVRGAGASATSEPVVGWSAQSVEVAKWPADRPWDNTAPASRRVSWNDLPPASWGVWLSREELLELLKRLGPLAPPQPADVLRLRAVVGRLFDDRAISQSDLESAKAFLPALVFSKAQDTTDAVSERLARINETWEPEASWGGVSFQFVPLAALP